MSSDVAIVKAIEISGNLMCNFGALLCARQCNRRKRSCPTEACTDAHYTRHLTLDCKGSNDIVNEQLHFECPTWRQGKCSDARPKARQRDSSSAFM